MNQDQLKILINTLAIVSMLAGAFGMLFCFPYLWSANTADLIGAGFPFVGGSVLFGAGLVPLGVFNKE